MQDHRPSDDQSHNTGLGEAAGTANRLNISLLGPMSLTVAGRPLRLVGRKARALLGCLSLSKGLEETRERLVGLLWSEFDEERARASLRQTIREIRQLFESAEYDGFRTEKLDVGLDPDRIELDVWTITEEAEQRRVHPLLLHQQRLADLLMQGLEDIDPEFRIWLLAKRHSFQERLLRALEAGMHLDSSDREARTRFAEAIINLDPTHEEACRALMQARVEAGDVAGALKVYKALWDLLDEEYGMEPSPATQKLVADIKSGTFETEIAEPSPVRLSPGTAEQTGVSSGRRPGTKIALAVGTIDVRGLDADKSYLAQGFRQHLVACLVRFREWYVTDQAAPSVEVPEHADIGAWYELSMLAEPAQDAIHLMMTLKEVGSNLYVWSDELGLKLENWFGLQRRIVAQVASAVKVNLSTERIMRLASAPDVPLGLYDRWLRCQAHILTFSPEKWEWAESEFKAIIAAAPGFTAAYCSLVQMNNSVHIVHPGVMRTMDRAQRSLELARNAVQLDPLDTRAQLCLGWAHALAGQFQSADLHMDQALEVNPHDPWTLISVALFAAFRGDHDRASELAKAALDVSLRPSRIHWAYQVSIAYLRGDYEGALRAAELAFDDAIKTLPAWRAAALFRLERHGEAHQAVSRFLSLVRSAWVGPAPPTNQAITRWLLHLYPISEPAIWHRLQAGLRGAGLPAAGEEFGAWWE